MEQEVIENIAETRYEKNLTLLTSELKHSIHTALKTYSNVHRGSGHNSIVTSHLYEQARDIVLNYMQLRKNKYVVIFCSPLRAEALKEQLDPGDFKCISSWDIGLSLGVRALAVKRKVLPAGAPLFSGGGTARLISRDWVVWAKTPDKFEAGTPAIINIIAFAKALLLIQKFGIDTFRGANAKNTSAREILYTDSLNKYSGHELLHELRKTLIGKEVYVPTTKGARPYVNLDNGASSPTFELIWQAAYQSLQLPGQSEKEIVRDVKTICSEFMNAPLEKYDVVFTSNTTEGINIVAKSLQNKINKNNEQPVIVNTMLEHNSNELPWRMIPGVTQIRITVDPDGFIDINKLETCLREYNQDYKFGEKRIKLVAINGASNVLGVFNDLAKISETVHRYGAQLLVDAAQLVAHRKVDIEKCNIEYLAFSAHKMYAPFGSGALIVKKGLLKYSEDKMQLIRLSGEENVAGIAAMGKAFVLLQRIGMEIIEKEEKMLTSYTLSKLSVIPGIKIFGIKDTKSPEFDYKGGVIVFTLNAVMPNQIAGRLALHGGIGIRYGCHCSHILVKRLHKIPAFLEGLQRLIVTVAPKIELPGVARVSLGMQNTTFEIDELIQVLWDIAQKSENRAHMKNASVDEGYTILSTSAVKIKTKDFIKEVSNIVYN